MSHTRKISVYAKASLFLLVSSITVLPLFSQDSTVTSFAQADITVPLEQNEDFELMDMTVPLEQNEDPAQADITASLEYHEALGTKAATEFKLSQKDHEKLMTAIQILIEQANDTDKKEAKKLPIMTPAFLVSIFGRLSGIYLYYAVVNPFVKETLKNEALSEVIKISFLTWILTEPFKDHTKPHYEYYRDAFDNYINNFFGWHDDAEESVVAAAA